MKDLNGRTLYIKGFPTEATCDDLLAFFDKLVDYEKMVFRRERKSNGNKIGNFKGSVFLIFKKDREAMDFLAKSKNADQKVCYNESPLEVSSKEEYIARKAAERNKGKSEKEQKQRDVKKEEKGERSFVSLQQMQNLSKFKISSKWSFEKFQLLLFIKHSMGMLVFFSCKNGIKLSFFRF